MIVSVLILSVIGFAISCYAFFVEQKIKQQPGYKPACDISDAVSCSKPILSEYGNLFFISNSIVGMILYALIFVLAWFGFTTQLFYVSLAAVIASAGLAYILYTKIKSFCLICSSIYVVNILLFIMSAFYL